MARIMIKCPITGELVPTSMSADAESFQTSTFENNVVQCSACGGMHTWHGQDAVLE